MGLLGKILGEPESLKQVIVLRTDLKMGLGKAAAQACHASVESYEAARRASEKTAKKWRETGGKKIVVKAESEKELYALLQAAKDKGVPCALIQDAGHTQLEPGTTTALGLGPWNEKELDELTGTLKLL